MIATLADGRAAEDIKVIVVTGDRDSYQLVRDPHIRVLYNKRGVSDYALYDEAGILERTGVTPVQYLEYAALRGDTSDNLPGVPGIGEKTAAKLVHARTTRSRASSSTSTTCRRSSARTWASGSDQVFHNREMSILRRNVPLDVEVDQLRIGGWDQDTRARAVPTARVPHAATRACSRRSASPTTRPRPTSREHARRRGRAPVDAKALAAALAAVAARRCDRTRSTPTGRGRSGDERVAGPRHRDGRDSVAYTPADLLADAAVRHGAHELLADRRSRRSSRTAQGADARAAPGRGVTVETLDLTPRSMAYLVDPGEGKYDLGELCARFCGFELTSPDASRSRARSTSTATRPATTPAGAPRPCSGSATRSRDALDARELATLYEDVERPLVGVLAAMEDARRPHRP